MSTPELRIDLLGPVAATVDGRPVALGSPKQRAVLAVLAFNAGRVVPTQRLLDELWGPDAGGSALITLRSLISRLRSGFSAVVPGAGSVLVLRRPGYVLDVSPAALDGVRFRAEVVKAHTALRAGQQVEALALVDGALAMVRDEPLVDVRPMLGLESRADLESLDEALVAAWRLRVQSLLDGGRAAAAAAYSAGLMRQRPLDEGIAVPRMRALAALGRSAEALELFEQVRRGLAEEFGVSPGVELQQTYLDVLGAPETFVAAPEPPRGLSDGLVGRDGVVTRLTEALRRAADGHGSVWLVAGGPGSGRTSVARAVEGLATAAGIRILFISLPPDRAHRTGTYATALRDVVGVPRDTPFEDMLRSIHTPVLFVVDDLHWADTTLLDRLRGVGGLLAGTPALLLCTTAERGVAAARRGLALGLHTNVVELDDLDREQVARLLDARGVPSTDVHAPTVCELSGGNAQLVDLCAAALLRGEPLSWASPPAAAAVVLQRWLADLGGVGEHVLGTAAFFGSRFPVGGLARVADVSWADLEAATTAATRAGLVEPDATEPQWLRFRHGWLRGYLVAAADAVPAARIHAAVARELVALGIVEPDDLADHLLRAAIAMGPRDAAELLLSAEQLARDRSQLEVAAALARRARTFAAQLPTGPERTDLELTCAERLVEVLEWVAGAAAPSSVAAVAQLWPLVRAARPGPVRLNGLRRIAEHLMATADFEGAVAFADQLRSLDDGERTPASECLAAWTAGVVAWCRGEPDLAVTELSAAVAFGLPTATSRSATGAEPPEELVVAAAGSLVGAMITAGRPVDPTLAREREAGRAATVLADAATSAAEQLWRAIFACLVDDHVAAAGPAERGQVLAAQGGFRTWLLLTTVVGGWAQARLAAADGDLPQARAAAERALAATRDHCRDGPVCWATLAWALTAEALQPVDPGRAAECVAAGIAASDTTGERLGRDRLDRMLPAAERQRTHS